MRAPTSCILLLLKKINLTDIFFCTALIKAGKHMEDSVVAAYVALLLGCILQENEVSIKCLVHQNRYGDLACFIMTSAFEPSSPSGWMEF